MRRFRSLAVTVLLGCLLAVALPVGKRAQAVVIIIGGYPAVYVANGLAPPEPDNVIDAADDYSWNSVVVRNAGCPPAGAYDPWDPCPSPGEATEVALVTGGYVAGGLHARDTSTITMSGGSTYFPVNAHDASTIFISGGTVESDLYAYDTSRITLAGGTVGGQLRTFRSGRIWIVGSGFQLDGVPVPFGDLIADSGTLTGTLASGDSLNNPFLGGWLESSITLVPVPEPTTALCLATGLAALAVAGRRRSLH